MEFAYEKLLKEHNLSENDMPEDAKYVFTGLKQLRTALTLNEKKGRTIRPETMAKIKTYDKWAVREILDVVEEKERNTPPPPVEEIQEVIHDIKEDEQDPEKQKIREQGYTIEKELEAAHKAGKAEMTMADVKSMCPQAYEVIFSGYKQGTPNGVQTTKYALIEEKEKPETFKLTAI